jgi:hypothetical protein
MYRAINPKTSGQGHYVQLPFNTKGFQQSLAGVAMNNHYHCKPISKPLQAQRFELANKVATTHDHPVCKHVSVVSKLMMKLTIH